MTLNKSNSVLRLVLISLIMLSVSFGTGKPEDPPQLKVDRNTLKNFVKSLIIPGWGQWENGNKIKAITFLTAEIAGIYGYNVNYTAGEDKETEFKIYGDEHWDYTTWSYNDNGETACGNLRTHQMPTYLDGEGIVRPIKDHHFYENISKYPEFVCGWDDIADKYDDEEKVYTPNKLTYIKMRTRSNELYKNAQLAGTLIMVNHLISAFDAALGTDITTFETPNMTGKFYINPLNAMNSIRLEVKF